MNPLAAGDARSPPDKGPDAFRTISEVAEDLDVPQHVLRFWETRFGQIKPLKRGGGRRYYRRDDVDLLKGIRHLLYGEGYTIKGVQRILKTEGVRFVQAIGRGEEGALAAAPAGAAPAGAGQDAEDPPQDLAGEGAQGFSAPWAPEAAEPPAFRPALEPAPERGGPVGPVLTSGDLEGLRSALEELQECVRVLGSLELRAEPEVE